MISQKGTVSLCNMPTLPEPPTADTHTEKLFDGVNTGEWVATKFATTPPVRPSYLIEGNVDDCGNTDVDLPRCIRQWRVRAPREFLHKSTQRQSASSAYL